VLTPHEVHAFNEKAQKFGQIEALQVTWGHEEAVALSLTLRPLDRAIRHTRMILRAKGVRGLRLYPDRVDVPEVGCLQIRNIADRGWENANFEVLDIEQNEALGFYCADLEVELETRTRRRIL
jgi:hypothetical protein